MTRSVPSLRIGALLALFALATVLWTSASAAQRGFALPGSETLRLNQKRMRIDVLIQQVGEALERTILYDKDAIRGSVSIISQRPVAHDEAWAILESSLSLLGHSLIPSTEGNWRIAKVADAVGEAPFRRSIDGASESYVTTIISLRYASISDILKIIESLAGGRATLVPFERTNSIIASGVERSIARLIEIANELDQIDEQTLRQRVLRYRDVGEVEPLIESFVEARSQQTRGLELWSDERTNSVVLRGSDDAVDVVFDFLDRIDQPIEGEGAIRILRVLHRDPGEVAELIQSLAGGPGQGGVENVAAATQLDGADFTIAVDDPSRSLVIRADAETHLTIRELVERLDEPPRLIAVDATVSRLSTPIGYGLGFGFLLPFSSGNEATDIFGFVQNTPNVDNIGIPPTLSGTIQRDTGVSFQQPVPGGGTVTVPILQSGTIVAGDFRGRNEVLIQPSLIVTAGEEHEIFVGNNVPIPVTDSSPLTLLPGQQLSLAAVSRTTRFDRQDIGTRLAFEASAGKEGKIQLDLDIEISAIDPTRAGLAGDPTQVGPSFVEQTIDVTARLDDGETAILAVDDRKKRTRGESGVPFMRDLPFFGQFFRTRTEVIEEVRLIVAVRARRVSNPSELVADTIRRRLAFERRRARNDGLPTVPDSPFGVRVTTRSRLDDAEAIAEGLSIRGYRTLTHAWSIGGSEYYDVYVVGMASMVDAADLAEILSRESWDADMVVFPTRSRS